MEYNFKLCDFKSFFDDLRFQKIIYLLCEFFVVALKKLHLICVICILFLVLHSCIVVNEFHFESPKVFS
jgi:hypothetical protein